MKLIIFIWSFILSQSAYSLNTVATGYQIPTGGSPVTINAHGICRIVKNNRSEAVFVPTKQSTEWASFRSNPPTNVTLENCCFGYKYGGHCYYLGAPGLTCTQVCAAKEGCSAAGLTYIGSSGTTARCKAAMDGVNAPIDGNAVNDGDYDPPFSQMGCTTVEYPGYEYVRVRMLGATTTCGSGSDTYERICSCNQ